MPIPRQPIANGKKLAELFGQLEKSELEIHNKNSSELLDPRVISAYCSKLVDESKTAISLGHCMWGFSKCDLLSTKEQNGYICSRCSNAEYKTVEEQKKLLGGMESTSHNLQTEQQQNSETVVAVQQEQTPEPKAPPQCHEGNDIPVAPCADLTNITEVQPTVTNTSEMESPVTNASEVESPVINTSEVQPSVSNTNEIQPTVTNTSEIQPTVSNANEVQPTTKEKEENPSKQDTETQTTQPATRTQAIGQDEQEGKKQEPNNEEEKEKKKDEKQIFRDASRQISFWEPPEILTVHLNRFVREEDRVHRKKKRFSLLNSDSGYVKNQDHVQFPFTLKLDPFIHPASQFAKRANDYSLYAVVEHQGEMNFGHYVAYVKRLKVDCNGGKKRSKWYYVSDSQVREVSTSNVQQVDGYLLFYERNKHDNDSLSETIAGKQC